MIGRAWTILAAVAWVCAAVSAGEIGDTVVVDGGAIRGVEAGGSGVRAYRGVPFAAPPTGDRRWRPPQAVVPWKGVRQCAKFSPACPQPTNNVVRTPKNQDEDCLYLNVWTGAKSAHEKRPVLFWIHGGGNTVGSASQRFYDGQHLAAAGVVLVSTNYRLGPLGYLAHPALSAESARKVSGNYGLLDLIAALKWVRRNIATFGGDAGNVTIFGESAGGVNCGVLLVSPPAKGLFHRAILQSGIPSHVRTRLRDGPKPAEAVGQTLFRQLGVQTLTDARRKSPRELLAALAPRVGLLGKGVKYGPIVDGWAVPDYPLKLIDEGRFHRVPILAGTNADEATLFSHRMPIRRAAGYRWLVRTFFKGDADAVLKVFPADSAATPKKSFERLLTVMSFVSPTRMLVRVASRHQKDTYLYHFTRVPPTAAGKGLGATHGLEIPYVFGCRGAVLTEPKDHELSEAMRRYWIHFARSGNPNARGLPEWPRYVPAADVHLELGDRIQTGKDLFKEGCDLFERIARREMGMRRPR